MVSPSSKTNLITLVTTEVVLKEEVFLASLQNSHENTCARVSFLIKLQASASEKRDSGAVVFKRIL